MAYQINIKEEELGQVIQLLTPAGSYEASIFTTGGLLNTFTVKTENKTLNCIDGFLNTNDAEQNITNGFKSAKLSPFVCRMNKGEYTWEGKKMQTDKFFIGEHAIHGLIYDLQYNIEASGATDEEAFVVLSAKHDYSNGYPFAYAIKIQYTLKENTITIITTVTNESTENIPMADGWHPYFTLGTSIDDCYLHLSSTTQVEFEEDLIPTGETFTAPRFENTICLANFDFDNCYLLHETNPAAILSNKDYKLTITANENYPYIQIYTPPHRNSIAIENLSATPDCFNNKMGLKELAPAESIRFAASYMLELL